MTTTDHATDHATDHGCDVSLIEQLKSVPLNSREWIKNESGLGLTNIPYGRYCQDAADALQKAKAEVERLRSTMRSFIDFMDKNLGTTADWLKELIYDDKETCQRGCDHINAMKGH